jgi:hypothetical protein
MFVLFEIKAFLATINFCLKWNFYSTATKYTSERSNINNHLWNNQINVSGRKVSNHKRGQGSSCTLSPTEKNASYN